MAATTIVEELISKLGLKVDKESFDVGDKFLEKIKHGLEIVAGFEGVKMLGELVAGVEESAVGAERMAQKLGISTDAVQQLSYASKVATGDTESLQVGFTRLARGVDEFVKTGKGEAAKAFERLGISVKQLKSESLDQNFELIAQKFAGMKDGAEKTALAMDLFGRSGANLIPLLNKGQAGIVELRNEATRLGIVIDEQSIAKFKALEETQRRLGGVWQGIKIQVAEALLPVLTDAAESVLAWVQANKELISSGLKAAIDGLVIAAKALADVIAVVADVVSFLADHSELAAAALIGLAGAMVIVKREAIISGLATAAAWALAAIEFLAIAAVIALIALGLYELYEHAEEIGEKFGELWDRIATGAREDFDDLKSDVKSVIDAVTGWIQDAIDLLDKLWHGITTVGHKITHPWEIAGDLWGAAKGAVGGLAEAISPTGGVRPPAPLPAGGVAGPTHVTNQLHASVVIHAPNANASEVNRIVKEQLEHQVRSLATVLGTGGR